MHLLKVQVGAAACLLAACSSEAHAPSPPAVDASRIGWSEGLADVDCRSSLPGSGLSDDDYWKSCARLDREDGGLARADEYFRRSMWSLFNYFTTPPYTWRADAIARDLEAFSDVPLEPAASADALPCVEQPAHDLALFKQPPWADADWRNLLDVETSTARAPVGQPLWDQHGRLVAMEVLILNRAEFAEKLATVEGQVHALCDDFTRSVSWGTLYGGEARPLGAATQLKFAWRYVERDEECTDYDFITRSGNPCARGEYGLVAMHIAIKTNTQADYWLWGTFSHENNVDERAGLAPLFRDPACASCEANRCPPKLAGIRRTQLTRLNPLADEVRATKLAGVVDGVIFGPRARYDLVGIQRMPAIAEGQTTLPLPRPEVLANEIIEWDRQDSDCIGCHARARVAALPDHDTFCRKSCQAGCRYCETNAGEPGACTSPGDACDCKPVERVSRYDAQPGNLPFALSDMTWIYDHVWNKKEEAP